MKYDTELLFNWIIDVLCGVEEMGKPYYDIILSENSKIREFDPSITDSEEYVWHRDRNDRKVTILEGDGWQFQFDNELPFFINTNDIVLVPKMTYHRIIPSKSKLRIKIDEFLS